VRNRHTETHPAIKHPQLRKRVTLRKRVKDDKQYEARTEMA